MEENKCALSLDLNNVSVSQFWTETGREFQTDGAAVLKERLLKEVRLNGTCSSGADDDRNDRVLLYTLRQTRVDNIHVLSIFSYYPTNAHSVHYNLLRGHITCMRPLLGYRCTGSVVSVRDGTASHFMTQWPGNPATQRPSWPCTIMNSKCRLMYEVFSGHRIFNNHR